MTDRILTETRASIIDANGNATISIGPQLAREQWDIATTTCTALGMTITVSQYGQVSDSTIQDPRPTATDNTPFLLMSGNQLTIKWANGTAGTPVAVTVRGKRRIGGNINAVR